MTKPNFDHLIGKKETIYFQREEHDSYCFLEVFCFGRRDHAVLGYLHKGDRIRNAIKTIDNTFAQLAHEFFESKLESNVESPFHTSDALPVREEMRIYDGDNAFYLQYNPNSLPGSIFTKIRNEVDYILCNWQEL